MSRLGPTPEERESAWRLLDAITRKTSELLDPVVLGEAFVAESTAAKLRRVEAELGSALSRLRVVSKQRDELRAAVRALPDTDGEIRQWYADHDLNLSCGPAFVFAALRRDFEEAADE